MTTEADTKIEPPTAPWQPSPQCAFWFAAAEANRAAGNNEIADAMTNLAKSYAGNH